MLHCIYFAPQLYPERGPFENKLHCNVFTQMKGYASKQYYVYVYILFYFTLLCNNLSKCNFDFVMKLNIAFLACILKLFLIDSANHIDILQIAYNIYMYLYT